MNCFEKLQNRLTLFFPMFRFDFSWKHHKAFGFLMFLIWIEKEHWEEMGELFIFLTRKFYKQVFAQFLVSIWNPLVFITLTDTIILQKVATFYWKKKYAFFLAILFLKTYEKTVWTTKLGKDKQFFHSDLKYAWH